MYLCVYILFIFMIVSK